MYLFVYWSKFKIQTLEPYLNNNKYQKFKEMSRSWRSSKNNFMNYFMTINQRGTNAQDRHIYELVRYHGTHIKTLNINLSNIKARRYLLCSIRCSCLSFIRLVTLYELLIQSRSENQSAGVVKCVDCISGYDTKLHLIVRVLFGSFEECGVSLYCHYSQVYSDPEWLPVWVSSMD